jgi:hypothetical protein
MPSDSTNTTDSRLFTHSRRPAWGVGLLTNEGEGRRSIRFQDGRLRTFKVDYYHMLEEFEASEAVVATMAEELNATHDAHAQVERRRSQAAEQLPVMTFDEQVRVFDHLFPGGFTGEKWLDAWRHPLNDGDSRKRHVDPALVIARERLSPEALESASSAEILAAAAVVLGTTGLASPSRLTRPLTETCEDDPEPVANALVGLLHGENPYGERARAFIMALDRSGLANVTWPMVTLLPALYRPNEHVAVEHRPFALQARSLDRNSAVPRAPSPVGYQRFLALAEQVRTRLTERGQAPRDLIDVRGFIWETLRPRGQQTLEEIRSA